MNTLFAVLTVPAAVLIHMLDPVIDRRSVLIVAGVMLVAIIAGIYCRRTEYVEPVDQDF